VRSRLQEGGEEATQSVRVAPAVCHFNGLVKRQLPSFNPGGVMFDDDLLRIPQRPTSGQSSMQRAGSA
jgi:hypothetical protein